MSFESGATEINSEEEFEEKARKASYTLKTARFCQRARWSFWKNLTHFQRWNKI